MRGPVAGWHLFVDAHVLSHKSHLLNDKGYVEQFFLDLADILGMDILDGPRITKVPYSKNNLDNDHDDGGLSGLCLISTSHISIHTWPLRDKFSLDAYSCKSFDCEKALDFIKERLHVESIGYQWHIRNWPS